MTITQNDVRLYASQRMTDNTDGGGQMSPTVIVDGVSNNVFPDITDIDRLTGRTSLRKMFGAVTNVGTDTYLSAHMLLDLAPVDAATSAAVFSYPGQGAARADAVAAFEAWYRVPAAGRFGVYAWSGASVTVIVLTGSGYVPPASGDPLGLSVDGSYNPETLQRFTVLTVSPEAFNGSDYVRTLTLDANVTGAFPGAGVAQVALGVALNEYRPFGVASTTAAAALGANSIAVDKLKVQVVPFASGGTYPTANLGIDPAPFAYANGAIPMLRANDPVLIHDTQSLAPQTVANAQTVDTLRTTLARLRVVGNNGVEIARFTRGITPPTGVGCAADLDAGTVTFSDVTGMSQPVTIEHRIEEMVVVSSISTLTLNLNRALSRAYPSGAKVSSLMMLGDLMGRAEAGFAQQAWTGVFSDSLIGGSPTADFGDVVNPITTTNAGAINERWAIIFTNTTSFQVIAESLGVVGTGSTGADYSPINPATGAPYFTIPAAGWGAGWGAGNVYRFNTVGANVPVWALRCVAPSTPTGADSVTVEFRGYVNA
jgi:hypothetical protein